MAFPLSVYSPGGRGRRGGLLIIGKDIAKPPPPTLGKETPQRNPGPLFPGDDDDDFVPPALVPEEEYVSDDDDDSGPELIVVFDDDGPVVYPDPGSLIEWQLLEFTPGSLDPLRPVRVLYAELFPENTLDLYNSIADPDSLDVFRLDGYPDGVFVRFPLEEPVWIASGDNRDGVIVDGALVPWPVEVARGMIDRLAEVHTKRFDDGTRAYHGNFLNSLFVDFQTNLVFLVLLSWVESEDGLEKDLKQLAIVLEAQGQDDAVAFIDANIDRVVSFANGEGGSRAIQSFYDILKDRLIDNSQPQ